MPLEIELPWPPTVNHYYLRKGNRTFISPIGISYRRKVIILCKSFANFFPSEKRLRMFLQCFPPDRRRRDLDNLGKCILDSLQHAHVYVDDNQIDDLRFLRMPELLGKVVVSIDAV